MANNWLLVFCKRNPTRKTYCLRNKDLFQESAVSSFQGALDMQETAATLLFINTFVHIQPLSVQWAHSGNLTWCKQAIVRH